MGKYTAPQVSILDVSRCLPALPLPCIWRIALYPRPMNSTSLSPSVEWCVTRRDGSTVVWRRFGHVPRTTSTASVMASLLHAAQEAAWFAESANVLELANRACWECDAPRP